VQGRWGQTRAKGANQIMGDLLGQPVNHLFLPPWWLHPGVYLGSTYCTRSLLVAVGLDNPHVTLDWIGHACRA